MLAPAKGERAMISEECQQPKEHTTQLTSPFTFHADRSEEHTSELQSQSNIVCRLLLEKKNRRPPLAAPRLAAGRPRRRQDPAFMVSWPRSANSQCRDPHRRRASPGVTHSRTSTQPRKA